MFCIFFFSLELILFSFSLFLDAGFVLYSSCVSFLPVFDSMHQHVLMFDVLIMLYSILEQLKLKLAGNLIYRHFVGLIK